MAFSTLERAGTWLGSLALVVLVLSAAFVTADSAAAPARVELGTVSSVTDGDTLRLRDGRRVRLLQIDAPELGTGECYSRAARTALLGLVPVGSRIALHTDPQLDRVDRYGRILRYLTRGSVNVNVALVQRGAAAPYFYGGERGKYAARLDAAARGARSAGRGLWGASPSTRLDPSGPVDTGTCGPAPAPPAPPAPPPPPATSCDPNYSGACVPPPPPDLDCADLRALGLSLPVRVVGSDPHRLDGDRDGYGCE
jgi:micrococcal nuclease